MTVIQVVLVLIVLFCINKYRCRVYSYWKSRGAPYIEPDSLWSGVRSLVTRWVNVIELVKKYYDTYPDKRFVGLYMFLTPLLIVRDPEVVKLVTIKEFDHFVNRRKFVDEEADPLFGKNLISIRDQRWRDMRNTLSPAFTAAKIRNMLPFIIKCGEQLTDYLDESLQGQLRQDKTKDVLSVELKDVLTKYATDVIATTAFGLQVDSFKEPDNEFYIMGDKAANFQRGWGKLRFLVIAFFPYLAKKLKLSFFGKDVGNFFRNVIQRTVKEREEKKIVRPDMIHLLMQARDGVSSEEKGKLPGLSVDDIAAQALLFFFAGFDTSSTMIAFTAYELALNPDIQQRLQDEIDQVIAEDGELTYEGVTQKMKYLDMVTSESLRKWPPAVISDRTVTKRYTIPGTDDSPALTLEKGNIVWIPIYALHRDPKNFPQPEKFDPERFDEDHKAEVLNNGAYVPFGMGPRNCIGKRFALLETKTCLVMLLRKYKIQVIEKTPIPIKLRNDKGLLPAPEGGFWLGLRQRSKTSPNVAPLSVQLQT